MRILLTNNRGKAKSALFTNVSYIFRRDRGSGRLRGRLYRLYYRCNEKGEGGGYFPNPTWACDSALGFVVFFGGLVERFGKPCFIFITIYVYVWYETEKLFILGRGGGFRGPVLKDSCNRGFRPLAVVRY